MSIFRNTLHCSQSNFFLCSIFFICVLSVLSAAKAAEPDAPLLGLGDHANFHDAHVHASHKHKSLRSGNNQFIIEKNDLEWVQQLQPDDHDPVSWPWHGGGDKNKTKPDNSCRAHQNCTSCTTASRTCHWCAKDEECHAKGSWYGCAIGESCDAPKKHNDTEDNSCHSHLDCTSCTLSSSLCHWCAFDEQCHAIASVYGCSHGVNCYSNDRCRRNESEHIDVTTFEDVGFVPIVIIVVATLAVMCCSTVLYAGTSALKGAVDDIAEVRVIAPPSQAFANHNHAMFRHNHYDDFDEDDGDEGEGCEGGELDEEDHEIREGENDNLNGDDDHSEDIDNGTCEEGTPARAKKMPNQSSLIASDSHDSVEVGNGLERKKRRQKQVGQDEPAIGEHTEQQQQLTENLLPVTAHPDPTRLPTNARRSNGPLLCLLRSCRVWYFFTIVTTLLFATACVLFFPKVPSYNVCSDEFAWQSIIDGLTSLKMEASFELLISVENKNRLDIALEGVGGTFSYDDEQVGTFTMTRSIIQASSITDVVVTCTVAPTRWEALGLISDYYKGKLIFFADITGVVKIRGIKITIPVKISNVMIKVNDPDATDRHLCACPQWKDVNPAISPALPFNEAVRDPVAAMAMTSVRN